MEKEFVPYEQALQLKELLDFNEPCFGIFITKEFRYANTPIKGYDVANGVEVLAPTFSQAFRWFDDNTECSGYIVPSIKERHFDWLIIIDEGVQFECEEAYSSRLEAEIACLKKLIEIAKTK